VKARARSFALLVALFTVVVAGLLWWQTLHSQTLLREQVLQQAEQRSLHVAGAMAGQVQAELNMLDVTLKDLRDHWLENAPQRFDGVTRDMLSTLPRGFVSHVTVVDAAGYLVYNSLGHPSGQYVGDRAYFTALRTGGDRVYVAAPVRSRLLGRWVFGVNRPILRRGRFEGVVSLVVESAFVAKNLAGLELSKQDVVSLIHADGSHRARSQATGDGKQVPVTGRSGSRVAERHLPVGDDDHAPRTYGCALARLGCGGVDRPGRRFGAGAAGTGAAAQPAGDGGVVAAVAGVRRCDRARPAALGAQPEGARGE
jgi:hypothetical protein